MATQLVLLSRRRLLLGAAAAGLCVAAYGGLRQVGCYTAPAGEFQLLSRKEARILQVLGDALIPTGAGLPGSGGDRVTLESVDALLSALPEHKRLLLRGLPLVFEHGTGLERLGAQAMTRLADDRRSEYLDAWARSGLVPSMQLWTAMKIVIGSAYFDRPDVLGAMNLPTLCGG